MQDAWRAYLELAMGLTEAPRKKAQDAVRRLVGTGGATAAQLQALAEELVSTGAANREALTKLVRFEVDRALGAVGLATADEVAELTRRVHELERQLREARAVGAVSGVTPTPAASGTPSEVDRSHAGAASTPEPAAPTAPVRKAVAKKTVAKKVVAKKTIAKKPPATLVTSGSEGTDTTPSDNGAAPARKTPAKKATGRRRTQGGAA